MSSRLRLTSTQKLLERLENNELFPGIEVTVQLSFPIAKQMGRTKLTGKIASIQHPTRFPEEAVITIEGYSYRFLLRNVVAVEVRE